MIKRRLINLQADTYLRLTALMEPKESYNDVVERLINLYLNVKVLSRGLEPKVIFMDKKSVDARVEEMGRTID